MGITVFPNQVPVGSTIEFTYKGQKDNYARMRRVKVQTVEYVNKYDYTITGIDLDANGYRKFLAESVKSAIVVTALPNVNKKVTYSGGTNSVAIEVPKNNGGTLIFRVRHGTNEGCTVAGACVEPREFAEKLIEALDNM